MVLSAVDLPGWRNEIDCGRRPLSIENRGRGIIDREERRAFNRADLLIFEEEEIVH